MEKDSMLKTEIKAEYQGMFYVSPDTLTVLAIPGCYAKESMQKMPASKLFISYCPTSTTFPVRRQLLSPFRLIALNCFIVYMNQKNYRFPQTLVFSVRHDKISL